MATIQKEIVIESGLDRVWYALRNFNAVHLEEGEKALPVQSGN
ncbi:hypothetical protein [Hydrogenophaga sp.]